MDGINKKLNVALSKLVSKPGCKITVTNLCDKAKVSRAAFYIYHKDLDDYLNKCREYIVQKFFEQIKLIMKATDKELETVLLRKNIVFDDTDIILLRYFADGNSYFGFADASNRIVMPQLENLIIKKWGQEYYENNRFKFKYFFNGFITLLYFDLINYNENKIKFEVFGSRAIAKILFTDVFDSVGSGNWFKIDEEIYRTH